MHGSKWFLLLLLACCLLACGAPAPEPSGSSSSRLTSDTISDRYIVVLRKGATVAGVAGRSASDVATLLQRQHGGKVVHTYQRALRGAAMVLPPSALERLRQDSRVDYIEPDRVVSINAAESNASWGLDRVDQRQLPLNQTYVYPDQGGQGVHAYVLDTGIYAGHAEFGASGGGSRVIPGYDFIDGDSNPDDCHGHGTHVAATLGGATYGLAKKVTLHSVRVLDCDGHGTLSSIIAGVDWVTAHHEAPAVANMSLSTGFSQALNDAVAASIAEGILYGVAAGNEMDDACSYSPGSVSTAITVGATGSSDGTYFFSNYGSCVDLYAPGQNITSAWIGSATATKADTGTSMAAPHVVGSAALWLGLHPAATPGEVAQVLTLRATPDLLPDRGDGSPNLLLYMGNMVGGVTNPAVASMSVTPSVLDGSGAAVGTVLLSDVAPAGGTSVALSSSDAAVVVPGTLLVPEGSQGATFAITALPVTSQTVATLGATYPTGVTATSTLTVIAPFVSTLTVNPGKVEGGGSVTGTVQLNIAAPAGGAVVTLSTSHEAVGIPASVTIASGQKSASFPIATTAVGMPTAITISATYPAGTSKNATLRVVPSPTPVSLVLAPSMISGGSSAIGTVNLSGPAPAGGAIISLTSSNTFAVSVPATLTIAGGSSSGQFSIVSGSVSTNTDLTVAAEYNGLVRTANLTVQAIPAISAISLDPSALQGGGSAAGTLTLQMAAPRGGAVVALSSSDPAVSVPASVTVAPGATSASFPIMTTPVDAQTSVTITGTYPESFSRNAILTVAPSPTPVSLTLPAVYGGNRATGTLSLSGPAPAGGAAIALASSNPAVVAVPDTLVIPAGANAGVFPITTVAQSTNTNPTISASYHGLTVTAALTVKLALPAGNAVYDSMLLAPQCAAPAPTCDSGWLLDGKAQLGPEINAPNTIGNSCSDGPAGIYQYQTESIDRMTIRTVDGTNLAPGKQVTIEVNVSALIFINDGAAEDYPSEDRLDLYLTTNANATPLTWMLLTPTSIIPPSQVPSPLLTYTFVLPATSSSNLWAIRGNYRWMYDGGQGACQPDSFVDYDDLVFAVDTAGPLNRAPVVNAGVDQTVTLPRTAALAGTVSDDGLPNPPRTVTTTWTKVSGPGTITFVDASALSTTATFSAAGSYVLRLTASDGAVSSSDDVVVTVNAASSPCAGFCNNPIPFTISGSYESGNLGTGARCYQTTSTIQSGTCGWFANGRTLKVNGVAESCSGSKRDWTTIPAKVNGGYCLQIGAGSHAKAYFAAQ